MKEDEFNELVASSVALAKTSDRLRNHISEGKIA